MMIWNNVRMFLWMTFLTGILYPLVVTAWAQLMMKQKADGDFIIVNGRKVGSVLIAQKFESEKYFWPRPSAIDYNPLSSGGSNLGPTSKALKKAVEERQAKLSQAHGVDKANIPAELLFASGSGLDPHISVSTAYFQMERVAKARSIDLHEIKSLIDSMLVKPKLRKSYINVFLLNKSLDEKFNK